MSPAVAWLIAEMTKLLVQRIEGAGKFNTLTQAEAEAMVTQLSTGLSTSLPTPDDLEKG
jgi:hypothetical protein